MNTTPNLPVLVPKEVYYRYREKIVGDGYTDFTGEYVCTGSHVEVVLDEFEVLKHTPKGAWIANPCRDNGVHGSRQFINNSWTKRYALPTREEAFRSFVARKAKYIQHLERKISESERALELASERHLDEFVEKCFKEFNYTPRLRPKVDFFVASEFAPLVKQVK